MAENVRGFDTEVHTIELDDYNQEYGDFPGWAEALNASWDRYAASTDEDMKNEKFLGLRVTGTNGTGVNAWKALPRTTVEFHDSEMPGTDGMTSSERQAAEIAAGWNPDEVPGWTLTGTATALRHLYEQLLQELATPAWHWYGMGGDDHAYDYWPNGMAMAVQFRDQLLEIGEAEKEVTEYHTRYLREDLDRVYWLVRLRWEADQSRVDAEHAYPGGFDDFLEPEEFGSQALVGLKVGKEKGK